MRYGFSLVELSIVLVILGLLTGGILAGQSLIRASELRSVITEYQRYVTATQTFRDKYMAIPGDMPNATRFWGRLNANADCLTSSAVAVAAPGTCDGDGDGFLEVGTIAANASSESLQYYRQLSLSGMIEGAYSGVWSSTGTAVPAVNRPQSKLPNAGWYVNNGTNYAGDSIAYALDYGNFMEIYSDAGPPLAPEEAWNIDVKTDDGRPAQGKLVARYWNNICAAADDGSHANNDYQASYRVSDSTKQCSLIFRQQF